MNLLYWWKASQTLLLTSTTKKDRFEWALGMAINSEKIICKKK